MPRKLRIPSSSESDCPINSNLVRRVEAEALAASIRGEFPKGVASPALRALAGAGITRLDQLTRFRESELLELHGMGPKAIATLAAALKTRGLSFAGQ